MSKVQGGWHDIAAVCGMVVLLFGGPLVGFSFKDVVLRSLLAQSPEECWSAT
jgi:hypothetical protein